MQDKETRSKIKEELIRIYNGCGKDIEETMKVLENHDDPDMHISRKRAQGILVYAKEWKKVEREQPTHKDRRTKKDIIKDIEDILGGGDLFALVAAKTDTLEELLQKIKAVSKGVE